MGIFESLLIGISIAAIPGPVFFELTRRALTKGFWAGILINAGQFFGNISLLALIFFGIWPFLASNTAKIVLYLTGSIILIWLGISALRLKNSDIDKSYNKKISNRNSFFVGFGIATANPIVVAFWISLAGSYLMQFSSKYLAFLNIVLIAFGFVVFFGLLSALMYYSRHRIPSNYLLWLSRIFGMVLIVYGISFLYQFVKLVSA